MHQRVADRVEARAAVGQELLGTQLFRCVQDTCVGPRVVPIQRLDRLADHPSVPLRLRAVVPNVRGERTMSLGQWMTRSQVAASRKCQLHCLVRHGAWAATTQPQAWLYAGNKTLMLSLLWIRRIASPKSGATETT